MDRQKCYELLELSANASLEEIKTSYRRLALKYHPDVNPNNQEAHSKFVELNRAYNLLIKEEKPRKKIFKAQETHPSGETNKIKIRAYSDLRQMFREGHLVSAIALIEKLAQTMPQDMEVRQWLAITYQQWGKQLVREGKKEQGFLYLQKAIITDPHNRSLWQSVQEDLKA
jgi:curved DNA-binding protein CbpA